MNLNLQISFGVFKGRVFSCGRITFLKNHFCTADDFGMGGRGFGKTHKTSALNITLSCMAMAFTGLTNSSEEYSVQAVIAREAGLQKKGGQLMLPKATLSMTQIIFPICEKSISFLFSYFPQTSSRYHSRVYKMYPF